MSDVVLATIKVRGDTAANWSAASPVLQDREIGVATDTHTLKVGDGATAWNDLPPFTTPASPILSAFAASEVENFSFPYIINENAVDYLRVYDVGLSLLALPTFDAVIEFLGLVSLQGRVATLESKVGALEGQVSNLFGRVAALETP